MAVSAPVRRAFPLTSFAFVFLVATLSPSAAHAQPPQPVSGFVVDARGAIPFLPNNDAVAVTRGTTADEMPTYGLGLQVGAHGYLFRWKAIAFGVGGSFLASAGQRTPATVSGSTTPVGPTVKSRFRAMSPQLSLNFGHRRGWSYLSGGIGRSTFRSWRDDRPEEEGESTKTLDYGGGARWFVNNRLAFSLDFRFYAMNPVAPSEKSAGHPRMTFGVGTLGISVR
jgi:hypothetical protein